MNVYDCTNDDETTAIPLHPLHLPRGVHMQTKTAENGRFCTQVGRDLSLSPF